MNYFTELAYQLTLIPTQFKARATICSIVVDDFDEVRLVGAVALDPLQHFGVHSRWIAGGSVVSDGLQVRLPQAFPVIQVRVCLLFLRHCSTDAEPISLTHSNRKRSWR
jgi:hypothetical protein